MLVYPGANNDLNQHIAKYNLAQGHFNNVNIRVVLKKSQFENYETYLVTVIEQAQRLDPRWYETNKLQLFLELTELSRTCEALGGLKLRPETEGHLARLQREIHWIRHGMKEIQEGLVDAVTAPIKMFFHPIETMQNFGNIIFSPIVAINAVIDVAYNRPLYFVTNMVASFWIAKGIKQGVDNYFNNKIIVATEAVEKSEKIAAADIAANTASLSKETADAAVLADAAAQSAKVAKEAAESLQVTRQALEAAKIKEIALATKLAEQTAKAEELVRNAAHVSEVAQKAAEKLSVVKQELNGVPLSYSFDSSHAKVFRDIERVGRIGGKTQLADRVVSINPSFGSARTMHAIDMGQSGVRMTSVSVAADTFFSAHGHGAMQLADQTAVVTNLQNQAAQVAKVCGSAIGARDVTQGALKSAIQTEKTVRATELLKAAEAARLADKASHAAKVSQQAARVLQETARATTERIQTANKLVAADKAAQILVVQEAKSISTLTNATVRAAQTTGQISHLTLFASQKFACPDVNQDEIEFLRSGEKIHSLDPDATGANGDEKEFMQYMASTANR